MVPYKDAFLDDGVEAVEKGYIPEWRLDIAVDHILALKHRVGLITPKNSSLPGSTVLERVQLRQVESGVAIGENGLVHGGVDVATRTSEDEQSAAAAVEGIVLLKNDRWTLPAQWAGAGIVAVVGPSAQSAANLVGGWSVHWQGPDNAQEVFPSLASAGTLAHFGCQFAFCRLSSSSTRPGNDCQGEHSRIVQPWQQALNPCRCKLLGRVVINPLASAVNKECLRI
jgi:beta-glucosidase-like glycosyl hydrolase